MRPNPIAALENRPKTGVSSFVPRRSIQRMARRSCEPSHLLRRSAGVMNCPKTMHGPSNIEKPFSRPLLSFEAIGRFDLAGLGHVIIPPAFVVPGSIAQASPLRPRDSTRPLGLQAGLLGKAAGRSRRKGGLPRPGRTSGGGTVDFGAPHVWSVGPGHHRRLLCLFCDLRRTGGPVARGRGPPVARPARLTACRVLPARVGGGWLLPSDGLRA